MNLLKSLLLFVLLWSAAAFAQTPKLDAKLYADHVSIQPGGETELAVELKLTEGWHIYHPINLDGGAPTRILFTLPDGAEVGDLRFPIPTFGEERSENMVSEYFGFEKRAVVLTTLKLAPGFTGAEMPITASVKGLACKDKCVIVEAQATLALKVSPETPAPAEEKLFADARRALPKPLAEAPNLNGSRLLASDTKIPVGGKSILAAIIRVKARHHIQDRDPGVENMIPSRLYIESRDGLKIDAKAQIWPRPRIEVVEEVGKVREQAGDFVIQVPIEVEDKELKPGAVRLRALFQYQACKDKGECYALETAEGYFEFEVVPAGATAVKNDDPLLQKLIAAAPTSQISTTGPSQSGGESSPGIPLVFLWAFIGGAILNITPCVLPVISLKIFSFVRQAGENRRRVFQMGLVYTLGILASFAVLAALMMGARFAWGGLMQRPGFLIGLSAVVFAFALSLLGLFEIQLPGAAVNAAGEAASREGYAGAFLNGIFAVLLATPCVAPFLGAAVGLLVQMPAAVGTAGIMVAGLGLATPYLLLTAFPGWLRFMPKPGPWMVTFKQVLGFLLVVVVVWLLSVLITVVPHGQFLGTLGLLAAVGAGCWLLGKITLSDSAGRSIVIWVGTLVIAGGGGWLSFRLFEDRPPPIPWQRWEPGLAERLAEEGYTVYVDYTATWCLTCQANKKLVLERKRVVAELKKLGVYPVEADFTAMNSDIQEELRRHDRQGVPLNIILSAGKPNEPIILPELLTTGIVLEALERAGPSRQKPDFWGEQP